MKTIKQFLILATLLLIGSTQLHAQEDTSKWNTSRSNGGFSERLANTIKERMDAATARRNAPVDAQLTQSLATIVKEWPEQNKLTGYRPYSASMDVLQGASYGYFKFEEDTNGLRTKLLTSGFLNDDGTLKEPDIYEAYAPAMYVQNAWFFEDPLIPAYTGIYRYNTQQHFYITQESIVHYEVENNKDTKVKTLLSVSGKKGKKVSAWMKEIEAYRRWFFEKKETDQDELVAAEIANRNKYTLKNKEVASMKIVYDDAATSKGVSVGQTFTFGIEVTFADGSTDKTHNLGGNLYISDFTIEGLHNGTAYEIGKEYQTDIYGGHCHCKGGSIYVSGITKSLSARDVVQFKIKSKYGSAAVIAAELPLRYSNEISVGSQLEVRTTKHSETGQELVICKSGGRYYRVLSGGKVRASSNGSQGNVGFKGSDCHDPYCHAGNGGDGGRGGPGGTVNAVIDPSASGKFKPYFSAAGGAGGPGGDWGKAWSDSGTDGRRGNQGPSGKDGTVKSTVGKVSF